MKTNFDFNLEFSLRRNRLVNSLSMCVLVLFGFLLVPGVASSLDSGSEAPGFSLKNFQGLPISLEQFKGKIVVLEWFNPDCPFVKKHYQNGDMQALQENYLGKGVVWLTISSSSNSSSSYLDAKRAALVTADLKLKSSHLLDDSSGEVGRKFGAKTTPQMVVIDGTGKVVYQGAIDADADTDSNPRNSENFIRPVLDALLAGHPLPPKSTKPYGCSVKY